MVIGLQFSAVSTKAGSFFSCLGRLLLVFSSNARRTLADGLGRAPDGKGTGWVQLPVDIESGSVKAGALVPLVRPVADVVYEPGTNTPQVLRQVMAAECLLVVNTNAYAGYELRFYHAQDVEPELDGDGFYHTRASARSFASYRVCQVGDTLAVSGGIDGDSGTNVFAWSAAHHSTPLRRSRQSAYQTHLARQARI